jgi:hypothetical protein
MFENYSDGGIFMIEDHTKPITEDTMSYAISRNRTIYWWRTNVGCLPGMGVVKPANDVRI